MRSTRDFIIGTLTGLTVGLLVAPRTGEESRRWLKEEYDKRAQAAGGSDGPSLKDRLTALFEQVKAEVTKYTEQQKSHKERLADTGRFGYQREREQTLYSPPVATTTPTEEHNARIINQ